MLSILLCLSVSNTEMAFGSVSERLAKAGIAEKDVLLSIDGKQPSSFSEVDLARENLKPGRTLDFAVRHQGKIVHIAVRRDDDIFLWPVLDAAYDKKVNFALGSDTDNVPRLRALIKETKEPLLRDWLRHLGMFNTPFGDEQTAQGFLAGAEADATYVQLAQFIAGFVFSTASSAAMIQKAEILCDKHSWPLTKAELLLNESYVTALGSGNLPAAEAEVSKSADIYGQFGEAERAKSAMAFLATYEYLEGKFEQARKHAVESNFEELVLASGVHVNRNPASIDALSSFIQGFLTAREPKDEFPFWGIESWIGALQAEGRITESLPILDRFAAQYAKKPSELAAALLLRAKVRFAVGDIQGAKTDVQSLQEQVEQDSNLAFYGAAVYVLAGDIAAQAGDFAGADKAYRLAKKAVAEPTRKDPRVAIQIEDRLHRRGQTGISINRATAVAPAEPVGSASFASGKRTALLIATDKYKEFPTLANPILDAKSLQKALENSYGFETKLVPNPGKDELFQTIAELGKKSYGPADELLIFVAGHGTFDEGVLKDGMLVCTDSRKTDPSFSSYITYDTLSRILDNLPCRHVLLLMDVCFGGTFDKRVADEQSGTRGDDPYSDADTETLLRRSVKWTTRKMLASGGKEPVSDGRPGQHSPFVRKLLEILEPTGRPKVITFEDIVAPMSRLQTSAIYGDFGHYEPGSGFFFVRRLP